MARNSEVRSTEFYLNSNDTANLLGITIRKLLLLRQANKIRGMNISTNTQYDDWVFRHEDIERFVQGKPPIEEDNTKIFENQPLKKNVQGRVVINSLGKLISINPQ